MKKLTQLGLICGVLLFACLLIWQGIPEILQILFTSGWQLLCLPLVWLPSLIPATQAWRLLFINKQTPPFQVALLAIWMGRAVNNLLPVATIGGEILKARIITLQGCHVTDASASVLVDKTVQVLAVIVWGLIGVGLLLYSSVDDDLAMIALAGFAILAMGVGGFLFVQKAGMFTLLAKLGSIFSKPDSWEGIHQSAKEVDEVVLEIYSNRGQFTAALAYKSLGLVLQTSEVWLGCYLLGHSISLAEAMMLKSLTSTLSDVAFIIPNAYGIQEGAYIVFGSLIGLGPDLALAVSLATRVREVVIDVPGLLFWQRIEAKDYTSAPSRRN